MKYISILFALVVVGCASPKRDDYTKPILLTSEFSYEELNIKLDLDSRVDIRGVYNTNPAHDQGGMMYSGAAGAGGLVGQVIAHAMIANNAKNSRVLEAQKEADRILSRMGSDITGLTQDVLRHSHLSYRFLDQADTTGEDYVLSKPIFFISQDGKNISLRHVITVFSEQSRKKGKKKLPVYRNIIETVSSNMSVVDSTFQDENRTESIKLRMQTMYKKSLQLLTKELNRELATEGKYRSYKFVQGSKKRMERAFFIERDCEMTLIRNLRGWLIQFSDTDNSLDTCKA